MNDQLDRAITAALDDLVARTPTLGVTPTEARRAALTATKIPADIDRYPIAPPSRSVRRPRLAAIASLLVAGLGLAAFVLVKTRDVDTSGSSVPPAQSPTTRPGTPATIQVPSVEDEHSKVPWDRIAVAPGTIGWFQLGDLAPDLAARVGPIQAWSDEYTSIFFRCVAWTEAGSTVTCTKLAGGNYIATSTFGPTPDSGPSSGVGTQLGDGLDPAQVLWTLAQDSLWGYDEVTTPPVPTQIAVGSITGVSYRHGNSAYLVWERSPGVIVWVEANGFTDTEMAELAAAVHPATLPSTLPLLLTVGASVNDSNGLSHTLKVSSVNGIRCAGLTMFTECTRIDQGPAIIQSLGAGTPAVAAVAPSGTPASLVVTLVGGGQRSVTLAAAGLEIQTAIYAAVTGETLSSARVVDATGTVLQQLSLAPDPSQTVATTTAADITPETTMTTSASPSSTPTTG